MLCEGNEGVLNPEAWLGANVGKEQTVGYDPNTMSHATFKKYSEVGGCGLVLVIEKLCWMIGYM